MTGRTVCVCSIEPALGWRDSINKQKAWDTTFIIRAFEAGWLLTALHKAGGLFIYLCLILTEVTALLLQKHALREVINKYGIYDTEVT